MRITVVSLGTKTHKGEWTQLQFEEGQRMRAVALALLQAAKELEGQIMDVRKTDPTYADVLLRTMSDVHVVIGTKVIGDEMRADVRRVHYTVHGQVIPKYQHVLAEDGRDVHPTVYPDACDRDQE